MAIEATGSVEGVKRAVAADPHALGLLPAFAVAEELRLRTVTRLDVRPAPPRMRVTARLSALRARHPAIKELLDALRKVAEPPAIRRIS
jgi:DNA-binding transcriptional LysR family regulator